MNYTRTALGEIVFIFRYSFCELILGSQLVMSWPSRYLCFRWYWPGLFLGDGLNILLWAWSLVAPVVRLCQLCEPHCYIFRSVHVGSSEMHNSRFGQCVFLRRSCFFFFNVFIIWMQCNNQMCLHWDYDRAGDDSDSCQNTGTWLLVAISLRCNSSISTKCLWIYVGW